MDYCTQNCIGIYGNFDNQKICQFVKNNCQQDTVQFIQLYYCAFKNSFMVLITLGLTIALLLFQALSYISNHYLAPCVDNLMKSLNFSETLAGVTFLAFANGAPDVLTAIIAGNSSSQETAMIPFGSLFGAAIFSCAIILARVIKFSPNVHENGLKVHRGETIKPILFYLFGSCYLVVVSGFYQKMTWYLASVYLILYVIYGVMVIVDEQKKRKIYGSLKMLKTNNNQVLQKVQQNPINFSQNLSLNDTSDHKESLLRKVSEPMEPLKLRLSPEDEEINQEQEQKQGEVTRILKWYRVFLKFLFMITVPSFDTQHYSIFKLSVQMTLSTAFIMFSQGWILLTIQGFPIWVIAQGAVLIVIALIYLFIRNSPPKITWALQIYSFVVCIVWISYLVAVLINIFELVQVVTAINSVFIGMTFLACGNSIGDYFSIIAFAKKGKGMTAIAGIYSGQLFNLLIGLGVSYLIKGISKGTFDFNIFPRDSNLSELFDDSIVWTVIFSTLVLLVISFLYLRKNNWTFFVGFSKFLLIFYISFVGLVSLFAILSDSFGQISCNMVPEFIRQIL